MIFQALHQLSLAQLEERKTVTVATIAFIRYLEARGSIPRGETLLLHVVDMLYLLWLTSCEEIHFCGLGEILDFCGKWCLSVPFADTRLRVRQKKRLGDVVKLGIDR
jgi:hypothetical protein